MLNYILKSFRFELFMYLGIVAKGNISWQNKNNSMLTCLFQTFNWLIDSSVQSLLQSAEKKSCCQTFLYFLQFAIEMLLQMTIIILICLKHRQACYAAEIFYLVTRYKGKDSVLLTAVKFLLVIVRL